ncbi:MAG: tetratricopeptide repeat protein, partial [Planctomycetota bacterium]
RSRCLRDLGRTEEAVESLGRYLDLVPFDDEEWITLAILHSGRERWKEAEAAYTKAQEIDGESMLLWFNRGISARRAENNELLRTCYEKLEAQDSSDWRSLVIRGYLDEVEGRPWQAWEAFEEATDPTTLDLLDPEDRECTMTHALAYVVENDLSEQTEKLLQRCRETFTFSYDVLDQLRRFGNRHALKATDYAIVMRMDLQDEDVRAHLIASGVGGDQFFCMRNYRVLAESEEAAKKAALDFEEGLGATGLDVLEVGARDHVEDVFLGVWWLDNEVSCFAITSEEREAS